MFFISALLLCLSLGLHAAQSTETNPQLITKQKPETLLEPQTPRLKEMAAQAAELEKQKTATTPIEGVKIKLQSKDNTQPSGYSESEYPIELANHSVTIKNFVEDLGTDNVIPLEQTTKKVLDCLMMKFLQPLVEEKGNKLGNAREQFRKIKKSCPDVKEIDLLLQTNYLNIQNDVYDSISNKTIPFKSLIASLYADSLKSKILPITELTPNSVVCDNLPPELEPLVAGWLLHDLLIDQKMVEKKEIQRYKSPHVQKFRLRLSNSGTPHSFAAIWTTINVKDFWTKDKKQYIYLNPSSEKICTAEIIEDEAQIYDIAHGQCAMSNDGTYLLIIGTKGEARDEKPCGFIYNLNTNISMQPIDLEGTINNIKVALFNDKTNIFNILISKQENSSEKLVTCYSIDPTNMKVEKIDIVQDNVLDLNMSWSCINGSIIGIPHDFDITVENKNKILMYADQKLYVLSFDKNRGLFTYNEEILKQSNDFFILTFQRPIGFYYRLFRSFAAKNYAFIPNFETIMSHELTDLKYPTQTLGADLVFATGFDPNHFHINWIYYMFSMKTARPEESMDYTFGIFYPYDPKLLSGIDFWDKQITHGQYNVLIDIYVLYHYYMNPSNWRTHCEDFINPQRMLISPTIQKIYGLDSWKFYRERLQEETKEYKKEIERYNKYKPTLHLQPTKPKPQSWFDYTKQKLQTYKTQILGSSAVVASGAGLAWLWKYGKNIPSVKASTSAPNPIRPASQPSTFVAPAGW